MVDIFALALSHGLLALAAWRLLLRPDLDVEGVRAKQEGKVQPHAEAAAKRSVRRGVTWKREADDDA